MAEGQTAAQPARTGRAGEPALADPGHGPAVHGGRFRPAPAARSAGAGDRSRPTRPGWRLSSARCASARTCCARAGTMPRGWRRSSGASPRPAWRWPPPGVRWRAISTPSWSGRHTFPRPRLALAGEVEAWLDTMPAVEAEQRLTEALLRSRRWTPRPAGPRSARTAAIWWRSTPRRRARGPLLDRPPESLPDQHRPGRGRPAPAPARRPADPAAGRGHGASRPPPALGAAGVLVELGAQSWLTGTEAGCSRRCERRRACFMS